MNSLITKNTTQYVYIEKYRTSISLTSAYFRAMVILSQKNISGYLQYLYQKYHQRILQHKVSPIRKNATTEYQSRTRRYRHWTIQMTPYIWERYWDLRRVTGYSISYIIRIFIEWELDFIVRGRRNEIEEKGIAIWGNRWLTEKDTPHRIFTNYEPNSYAIIKVGDSGRNMVYIVWMDVFW